MSNHGGARDGPLTVVTGGTGVLGREAVPQLIAGGHRVRVLSRRPAPVTLENVEVATGDIATGEGLDAALAGSDMILHLASSPTKSKTVDVEGTSRLIAAAQRCGAPHLVYVSIVGVDRIPWPYYRSKLAAEESVAASGLPYSIQRMTQFHDFILLWLWYGSRLPVAVVPRSMSAQPLDVRDASTRLLHLLDERPQGRVPDMGGPEVLDAAALMRVLLSALDSHKRVVGVPIPGGVASGFRSGYHLAPEHADGSLTFASFVSEHLRRDGDEVTVEVPYRGSRRV